MENNKIEPTEVDSVKTKKPRNLSRLKNKKLILVGLMLLAIPLTVGSVLVTQELRSRAGGGLPIANVAINPGIIKANIETSKNPVELSALAYDNQGNPLNYGVNYDWSISSTDTVGTLTKTNGVISQFVPIKAGCGVLTVTATYGGQSMTKAAVIQVSDGNFVPKCENESPSPVSWKTDHVSLQADDFYLMINGQKFTAKDIDVKLNSSAPFPPDLKNTTFEATWHENGVEMRLFIDFEQTDGKWMVKEMRTYNANTVHNDWIYYKGTIDGTVGTAYTEGSFNIDSTVNPYNPSDANKGTIHFTNLKLNPYLVQIPKTGYYIYRTNSRISIPVSKQNTSYVAATFLYKDGQIVHDQTNLNYVWKTELPSVAQVTPFVENYDCQTNSISPCPQSRISVVGLKPGSTQTNLLIYDNSTQKLLASTDIKITVQSNVPTPTPVLKNQISLKCDANISLSDYSSTELKAELISQGNGIGGQKITWSRVAGTSEYPLISPGSSSTGMYGSASTFVWMPEGFKGSGTGKIQASFAGDANYYPATCITNVSYNIGVSPTPAVRKMIIAPSADAFVRSSAPTTNFGKSQTLMMDTNPSEIPYFKFDLSSLKNKTITKATLVLTVNSASNSTQTVKLANSNNWSETGLTYRNRPTAQKQISTFIAKPANGEVNVNVLSAVNLGKGKPMSLMITSGSNAKASIYSREASSSKRPQLIVEYK